MYRMRMWLIVQTGILLRFKVGVIKSYTRATGINVDCPRWPRTYAYPIYKWLSTMSWYTQPFSKPGWKCEYRPQAMWQDSTPWQSLLTSKGTSTVWCREELSPGQLSGTQESYSWGLRAGTLRKIWAQVLALPHTSCDSGLTARPIMWFL